VVEKERDEGSAPRNRFLCFNFSVEMVNLGGGGGKMGGARSH
jgi:hypothetical protein